MNSIVGPIFNESFVEIETFSEKNHFKIITNFK